MRSLIVAVALVAMLSCAAEAGCRGSRCRRPLVNKVGQVARLVLPPYGHGR